jgi:RNA polymerase sigma factor (sigma-70 family)
VENRSNEELVADIQGLKRQGSDRGLNDLYLQLFEQNKGLINILVKRYGSMIETEDALQESYIALVSCVDNFDSEKGFSFMTLYPHYLKAQLFNYARISRNMVLSPRMMELVSKYQTLKKRYYAETGSEAPDAYFTSQMKISKYVLKSIKEAVLSLDTKSIYSVIPGSEDLTIADTVPDEKDEIGDLIDSEEVRYIQDTVNNAVDTLPKEERLCIRKLYYDGGTYESIGQDLGLTRDRVRLVLQSAKRRLRKERSLVNLYRSVYARAYRGSISRFMNTRTSITEELALLLYERTI